MGASKAVIKIAKKTLKRQESGSMKIKSLAKSVLEKTSSDEEIPSCKDTVRKWIEESDAFEVEGKMVMLKKKGDDSKKRKSVDDDDDDGDGDNEGKSAAKKAKKAAKRAKKDKTKTTATTSSSSPQDESTVQAWRKTNKIVLKSSSNTEEGIAVTKSLAGNTSYFPFTAFDSPGCVEKLDAALIRQCTVVNGFERPSPIQAQCWVSLMLGSFEYDETI